LWTSTYEEGELSLPTKRKKFSREGGPSPDLEKEGLLQEVNQYGLSVSEELREAESRSSFSNGRSQKETRSTSWGKDGAKGRGVLLYVELLKGLFHRGGEEIRSRGERQSETSKKGFHKKKAEDRARAGGYRNQASSRQKRIPVRREGVRKALTRMVQKENLSKREKKALTICARPVSMWGEDPVFHRALEVERRS